MKKRLSQEEWVSSEEFFTTSYLTIDKIRQACNWKNDLSVWIAIDLFLFYCKCCSIQQTRQAYCTNSFCSEWLWYWKNTITKYKNLLEDVWCVEQICERDASWKVSKRYVKVNFAIHIPTSEMWFQEDVVSEGTNTGWYKKEILDDIKDKNHDENFEDTNAPNKSGIENKEKRDAFEEIRKSFPHPRTSNKKTSFENYMKNSASVDDIKKEIDLLNVEYFYGVLEIKYWKAFERWIRDIVPNTSIVYESRIKAIVYKHWTIPSEKKKLYADKLFTLPNDLVKKYSSERKELYWPKITFNFKK